MLKALGVDKAAAWFSWKTVRESAWTQLKALWPVFVKALGELTTVFLEVFFDPAVKVNRLPAIPRRLLLLLMPLTYILTFGFCYDIGLGRGVISTAVSFVLSAFVARVVLTFVYLLETTNMTVLVVSYTFYLVALTFLANAFRKVMNTAWLCPLLLLYPSGLVLLRYKLENVAMRKAWEEAELLRIGMRKRKKDKKDKDKEDEDEEKTYEDFHFEMVAQEKEEWRPEYGKFRKRQDFWLY